MNLCDSLLCAPSVSSFPELSLSAPFARRWPSLYEVFDDAQIDRAALQKLFVFSIPPRSPGKRLVLTGDATSIVRAESSTARDRTYVHVPNLPKGAKPVAPGWLFATVVTLDGGFGNATFIGLAHEIPLGKLMRTAKNRITYAILHGHSIMKRNTN